MSEEATTAPVSEPVTEPVADTPDPAALAKLLDEERRARGRAQKEAEKALAALKDRDDADKSELQKALDRVKELEESSAKAEAAARRDAIDAAASRAAVKLNFVDPDDAQRFLDPAVIEFDDAGRPINVDKLLADVAKTKPHLIAKARTPDAGQGERGRSATLTTDEIRRMTPEQINARWDEVSQALGSAGR